MEKVGAAGAPSAVSGAVTEVRYVRFPTMALSMTGQWSDVGHRDAAAPRRTVRRRRSRRANPPDLGHDRAEPGRPSSGRQGVVTMGIGSGIFLIVVGAVLAFALEPDTWDVVNLNIVGYVMIVGGIIALALGMYYNKQRTNTSHREVVERYDDRRRGDPAQRRADPPGVLRSLVPGGLVPAARGGALVPAGADRAGAPDGGAVRPARRRERWHSARRRRPGRLQPWCGHLRGTPRGRPSGARSSCAGDDLACRGRPRQPEPGIRPVAHRPTGRGRRATIRHRDPGPTEGALPAERRRRRATRTRPSSSRPVTWPRGTGGCPCGRSSAIRRCSRARCPGERQSDAPTARSTNVSVASAAVSRSRLRARPSPAGLPDRAARHAPTKGTVTSSGWLANAPTAIPAPRMRRSTASTGLACSPSWTWVAGETAPRSPCGMWKDRRTRRLWRM